VLRSTDKRGVLVGMLDTVPALLRVDATSRRVRTDPRGSVRPPLYAPTVVVARGRDVPSRQHGSTRFGAATLIFSDGMLLGLLLVDAASRRVGVEVTPGDSI